MFEESMAMARVNEIGKDRAIEELKFDVIKQLRAAGMDERDYSPKVYEEEERLRFVAVLKNK